MKRTDITKLFPEATKEQIDEIMSINGADINAAKSEVDDLRKQLTDQNGAEMAKAQEQIKALTAELTGMKNAETIRLTREKVANEKNIPVNLLTGETEEACAKQADEILAFATPKYPVVKDAGESHLTPKGQTRDQFADWARDNLP
ncbi:MAG: hypothetical protein II767_11070 [Proteobacteria bacterium]|nr:hypothetical protein [Pseudomonadota bacterium]